MQPPELLLIFETDKGEQKLLHRKPLAVMSKAIAEVNEFKLDKSFGTLLIQIHGCRQKPALVVSGETVHPRSIGSVYEFRLKLKRDLMFHRIAVVTPPFFSTTVDLHIEHHYVPKGWTGEKGVAKWSLERFKSELNKYGPWFTESNQNTYLPDEISKGFGAGVDASLQLLPQVIGQLELSLATVRQDEAVTDFCLTTDGEFDIEAILAEIKQNPERLTAAEFGSIHFKGRRYSTTLNQRRSRSSQKLDFSDVCGVLTYCAGALRKTTAPAALSMVLQASSVALKENFPFKGAGSQDFGNVLSRNMRSPFGSQLQLNLRLLVALINKLAAREKRDLSLLWLTQAIQDIDVFERSVFACCAKAFGFTHEEVISCDGVLKKQGLTVADTNLKVGMNELEQKLTSWRKDSIQPSEYHPDTYVLVDDKPVIIDAKFRMPESIALVTEPGGIKDVQAYMHDFSVKSALIVVPLLLAAPNIFSDGIECIEGGGHSIYIVAMQNSDDVASQARLKLAIQLAAASA